MAVGYRTYDKSEMPEVILAGTVSYMEAINLAGEATGKRQPNINI